MGEDLLHVALRPILDSPHDYLERATEIGQLISDGDGHGEASSEARRLLLAGLLGTALIFMGGSFFTTPQISVGFGIPDTPADDPAFRSWLRVKGLREIASGVFVFVLMLVAPTSVLGWYMVVFAAIPPPEMRWSCCAAVGRRPPPTACTAQRRW
ncbi:hypothetical protein P3T35_006062 [Kitasatospora sp. GP30]|nr:hypothetical protein [Kitasatospora sp. GP30]